MYMYKNLNNFRQEWDMGMGLEPFYSTHWSGLKFSALKVPLQYQKPHSAKIYGAWCIPVYRGIARTCMSFYVIPWSVIDREYTEAAAILEGKNVQWVA